MKSLERQLQLALAVVLILILLGLVIIANLSTKKLLTEFVSSRLELDAQRILNTFNTYYPEKNVIIKILIKRPFWGILTITQKGLFISIFIMTFFFMELFWRMLFEYLIAFMQMRDALLHVN